MSKITKIENAIVQIGAGEFQELCDAFLKKKPEYGLLEDYGKEAGTTKTTIGNPDTYLRRENGKYVLVVCTTQKNHIFDKIREDIEKCLDSSKTGL